MTDVTRLIDEAITNLAALPAVFTLEQVAAYADLNGCDDAIDIALQAYLADKTIIALGQEPAATRNDGRFLGTVPIERWWVENAVRWAKADVAWMSPLELARAMSLAFDTKQWDSVPSGFLDIGRRWATVADGYHPNTYVFPWSTVIECNPQLADGLRFICDADSLNCDAIVAEVLGSLTVRESDILKRRNGFDTGHVETLEQIGISYGVTRERIRQIERKAWTKLKHPVRHRRLRHAFASEFVRTGGSLLFAESEMTPIRQFLHQAIGLSTAHIPELGFFSLGRESAIVSYRNSLRDVSSFFDPVIEQSRSHTSGLQQFLSVSDGVELSHAEKRFRYQQGAKTRPRMLRDALRSLGRAAHFTEIADVCNRMFPDNQTSTHNWHAALGRLDSEALGIVWIGRKGIYGLKEHGYNRPETDLFDGAATIVESIFSKTNQPVSQDTVIAELSKQRRELHHNSVAMALSLNDRLESVGHGAYIPKSIALRGFDTSDIEERSGYDIEAAFAAFSHPDDTEKT